LSYSHNDDDDDDYDDDGDGGGDGDIKSLAEHSHRKIEKKVTKTNN
jgi:hypothetical protein